MKGTKSLLFKVCGVKEIEYEMNWRVVLLKLGGRIKRIGGKEIKKKRATN